MVELSPNKLLDEIYPTRNEEYDELFCCLADEDTVEIVKDNFTFLAFFA